MDLQSLAVADGTTPTPVTRTFTRTSRLGNNVNYRDLVTQPLLAGQPVMTTSVVQPDGKTGATSRITLSLKLPVVEPLNGVNQVTRYGQADIVVRYAPNSTLAERTAFAGLIKNLLAKSEIQQVLMNVEPTG